MPTNCYTFSLFQSYTPNQVRQLTELDALLREKIARPSLELTRHGQGVLQAVTALLAMRPPER